VASVERAPTEGWRLSYVNTYDFARVPIGASTLRIAVGGTNPPYPSTVRRILESLRDHPQRADSDDPAIVPENIVGVWRPPNLAYEVAAAGRPCLGSEFEIYERSASGQRTVVMVIELNGEVVRVLGACVQLESTASR
jgi:hypothetical protein